MQINRTAKGLAGLVATTGVLIGLLPVKCQRVPANPNPTDLILALNGGDDTQQGLAKYLNDELIMSDYSHVSYSSTIGSASNVSAQIVIAKGDHMKSRSDYLRDNREYVRLYFWNNNNGAITEVKILSNSIPKTDNDSDLLDEIFTIRVKGSNLISIELNPKYRNPDTTIRFALTPWNDNASFEKPDLKWAWPFRGDEIKELFPDTKPKLPEVHQKYPEPD